MPAWVPHELARILAETDALKQSYLVGGCVRDWLLGLPNHDYDIEVFGLTYEHLVQALTAWGRTDLVGRSFGVVKLTTQTGATFDFTIPRRDAKIAPGHRGFLTSFDPGISLAEAAARRDFTINSLMYDPREQRVLDFFGGQADLEKRVLRHTSAAFVEDPLRVLRGMQFAARFALGPAPETVALCREIRGAYRELAVERVREEWMKWASRSTRPSAGLRFLANTGWIEHFPELANLQGTPQDPVWHPEGDVFIHTCHCCDVLVQLPDWQCADEESRVVYSLATLAHDFAKPQTTQQVVRDGQVRIVSPGHEEAGGPLAEQFLARINIPLAIRERVLPLVTNHMAHLNEISDRAVRRLARRLEPENIRSLCLIMTADHLGRPPQPSEIPPSVAALQARAAELEVQARAPQPILLGRHLIELGMRPGKRFAPILSEAYEAQLEGKFLDLPAAFRWMAGQPQLDLTPTARHRLAEWMAEHG